LIFVYFIIKYIYQPSMIGETLILLLVVLLCVFLACYFAREWDYASGAAEEFDSTAGFVCCILCVLCFSALCVTSIDTLPLLGRVPWWGAALTLAVCAALIIAAFVIIVSKPPFNRRQRYPTEAETIVDLYVNHGSEAVGAYRDIMRAGKRPKC
jgi:peptidoglycan/LPS O-acetylase OafA/YrhL